MTDQLTNPGPTGGRRSNQTAVGEITTEPITAQIVEVGPAVDGALVYALTAPQVVGGAGVGIFSPHARIQNTSSFDIRLTRVTVRTFAESGGALLPSGVPTVFDSSNIAAGTAATVFATDDSDGVTIPAGSSRAVHIQKRSGNKTTNVVFGEGLVDRFELTFRFEAGGLVEQIVTFQDARAHTNDTTSGSYLYPSKAADLRPNELLSGASGTTNSHHQRSERHAYDTGVGGFDAVSGEWTGRMTGTTGSHLNDYRVFGRPLYAAADGSIVAMSDNAPDNPPGCTPDGGGTRNRLVLRVGDEDLLYLHLQRGSIHPSLSVGDTVRAGQFLARCGNSGTSRPHLHFDADNVNDSLHRPIHFDNMHVIQVGLMDPEDRTGPWVEVNGRALPSRDGVSDKFAIWPSRERPRRLDRAQDSSQSGAEVDALVAVALGPNTVATAARMSGSGRLRVFNYGFAGNNIVENGDSGNQAGVVEEVAVASLGQSRVATAVRTAGGRLKVITWALEGDGDVQRLADSGQAAGIADLVSVASLGSGRLVTLVRTDTGTAKLIAWNADGAGEVGRLGSQDLPIGDVDRLSITRVGRGQVATLARRTADERADLRLWLLSPDGLSFTELASSTTSGHKVSDGTVVGLGADAIVTARRDDSCNRLRVEYWDIDGTDLVVRGDGANQGPNIDRGEQLSAANLGSGLVATGVQNTDDRAVVQLWCAESGGHSMTLLGHSREAMGTGDLVTVLAPTTDRLVSVVRTASGRQKLIAFDILG